MKGTPVLDWLLEKKDPGVRAFALRDLLGAPADDPDVIAARRATVRHTPVKEILDAQQPEGWWVKAGPGYSPKYTGTEWQLIFLGQFGADGQDRRVRRGVDYILDHSRAPEPYGGFSCNASPGAMVQCLQGNLCAALLEIGYGDDPRLQRALEWLARSVTGQGIAPADDRVCAPRYYASGNCAPGFRCSANDREPCAWGAIPALDALSRIPPRRRSPQVRRAIQAGEHFLLSRDPAAADYPMGWSSKPSGSWFKFGYPIGYVQDVLRNLEVLTALGRGSDPRLKRAAGLILSKPDASGRWPLEYSYAGKTWFDIGAKRKPNKWVTLRALRVLTRMGVTV